MNRSELLNILNSDIFKSFITILISSGTTFLLTRTTEGKNDKKEIYRIQLEKIFLPLYLLASKINIENIQISSVEHFVINMSHKSKKYYLYIPSTYIKLHKKMLKSIHNSTISRKQLKILTDYIVWRYFYLKKKLNYPDQKMFIYGNFFSMYNLVKICLYFCEILISFSLILLTCLGGYLFDYFLPLYNLLMLIFTVGLFGIIIISIISIYFEILLYLLFRG